MGGREEKEAAKGDTEPRLSTYQGETARLHSICLKNGDSVNINCVRDISPDMKSGN